MIAGGTAATIVVIADLHLAAGRHDPFSSDAALVAFLDDLATRARRGRAPRLVLLGDTLDFTLVELAGRRLDPTIEGALGRLECIEGAHRTVFAALRRAIQAGVVVHIVPGNHDLELFLPSVLDRLRELLAAEQSTLQLHPWFIHLPGVAHLEHGQQHHDLNRVPNLLQTGARATVAIPAGTVYGEYLLALTDLFDLDLPIEAISARSVGAAARQHPRRLARSIAPTLAAARALARCEIQARRAGRAPGAPALRDAGDGMPHETRRELERVSASTPLGAVRRLAGRRAEHYMVARAQAVHDVLTATGRAVPYYVLAHTHEAADRPLTGDPAGPRYMNPGTWSRLAAADAPRCCYVELRSADGAPSARLGAWG